MWINGAPRPFARQSGRRKRQIDRDPRHYRALRLEFLEVRLAPATISWTGLGGDLDWTNGNNWSSHSVPGPLDDALIDISVTGPITVSGTQSINSLNDSTAAINISGSLQLAASSSTAKQITLSSGS